MASSINASTTAGVVTTADTSGVLNIQTAGTTAISIDASQAVSFTNAPTVTGGTANGVAYLNGSKVLTTGSALVFDGTNLGVGVTPSAWTSSSLSIGGQAASFAGDVNTVYAQANAYYNAGWKYVGTGYAGQYQIDRSVTALHKWYTAASGTAGNAITFTQAMTLDSSGNLGIGTSSPAKKLDVYLGTTGTVGQYLRNTTVNLLSQIDGTTSAQFGTETSHPLLFLTSNTERARIDSSGNLLVGATSTLGSVAGIYVASGGANVQTLTTNSTSSSAYYIGRFYSGGVEKGYIYFDGTNVSYTNLSDYRLKDDVQPMQNALDKVAQLNPVTYNWKANGKAGQGFIAHELQAVIPDCVTGEKDAVDADGNPQYQGIDTSFLVATLTAAIQEQQALITQLQADVAALKGA